jgi:hypothetical protein
LTAGTNLGGTGNTLLDFTVLLLLGEFVLDAELGFVDEGLFFEVEVVLGLRCYRDDDDMMIRTVFII